MLHGHCKSPEVAQKYYRHLNLCFCSTDRRSVPRRLNPFGGFTSMLTWGHQISPRSHANCKGLVHLSLNWCETAWEGMSGWHYEQQISGDGVGAPPPLSIDKRSFQFNMDGLLYSSVKPSVFSVFIWENTNCLKALRSPDRPKCLTCPMIRVVTACKHPVPFFHVVKSSGKVWHFGRWYENEL